MERIAYILYVKNGGNNLDAVKKVLIYIAQLKQDRWCTFNVILGHVRVTSVTVEKAISVTYSECMSVA